MTITSVILSIRIPPRCRFQYSRMTRSLSRVLCFFCPWIGLLSSRPRRLRTAAGFLGARASQSDSRFASYRAPLLRHRGWKQSAELSWACSGRCRYQFAAGHKLLAALPESPDFPLAAVENGNEPRGVSFCAARGLVRFMALHYLKAAQFVAHQQYLTISIVTSASSSTQAGVAKWQTQGT
jgi:hypothetical protein